MDTLHLSDLDRLRQNGMQEDVDKVAHSQMQRWIRGLASRQRAAGPDEQQT